MTHRSTPLTPRFALTLSFILAGPGGSLSGCSSEQTTSDPNRNGDDVAAGDSDTNGSDADNPGGDLLAPPGDESTGPGDTEPGDAQSGPSAGQDVPVSPYMLVDQFGYPPDEAKVAVMRDPRTGFDGAEAFTPGSDYQVRRWSDGEVVFPTVATAPVPWNGGIEDASAGDAGWWFDFSALTTPGSYFVYDVDLNLRSVRFEIAPDVYREVLKAATRMFFYNRAGIAKSAPYAEACWEDAITYVGTGQDTQARSVDAKNDAATERDLSGGWYDAGDTNKYVTFASSPVHDLLSIYSYYPSIWTDDFNIPESNNGIPDLLDEIKWETDWMVRMQEADGGVLIKVGNIDFNQPTPPSLDTRPRYYAPKCSSSTISAAGVFAHAALVFGDFPALASYADDLEQRAESAWVWYQSNPRGTDCDTQEIHAGDADMSLADQDREAVQAAAYLFGLTGNATYGQYVVDNYAGFLAGPWQDIYAPDFEEALLYYASLPGAESGAAAAILSDKTTDIGNSTYYGFEADADLYRSFITNSTYHWGSHLPRANHGGLNLDALNRGMAPNPASFSERAMGVLNYFHGVNPLGLVYLSNMASYGAERSLNEIYHSWFLDGSQWDSAATSCGPAPGYVPGGPNAQFSVNSISPPFGQPLQKTYLDWNGAWPENSWEITEPAIYYQTAYLRLLAGFVP